MGSNTFILGFADELVKLAQKPEGYYSPKAVMKRMGPGPMGPPEAPQMGPRPAPGTRLPKAVYPEKTWKGPKKFTPPKPKGPRAEGVVPGTFQRGFTLPSGKKAKGGAIVSAVGERKKWEARVKKEENKLPGWLSDSMKRPVKGHAMAKAEDVARSKKEDAAAKKMVAQYSKKPKAKRGGRRFAAKDYGPSRKDLWRMVPGKTVARTAKGGGTTGPTGIMRLHKPNLRKIPPQRPVAQRAAPPWKPQRMTVPGYKAVAKKRTI